MLQIPALGDVPRTLRHVQTNRITARTALTLLDHGLLPPETDAALPALIETAFREWLARHATGMQHIGIRIGYFENERDGRVIAHITMGTTLAHPLLVGKRLASLQKSFPGLGETVLWHLDHDLHGCVEIFTPSMALTATQWEHWGGMNDESEVAAEAQGEGETWEGITRAEFDRALPGWATRPQERIKPRALRALARRQKGLAGKVAAATLDLLALGGEFEPLEDGHRYWPPAQILVWGPRDRVTYRILDDFGNFFFQSGEYVEDFASFEIADPSLAVTNFEGFLATTEKTVRTLRAADRVLQLIGERDRRA